MALGQTKRANGLEGSRECGLPICVLCVAHPERRGSRCHVQMRKHNALYITRADTEIPQLRPNLLFTLNPKGDFPSQVRMEGLA